MPPFKRVCLRTALAAVVAACAWVHAPRLSAAPDPAVLAAAKACEPDSRALLQQLVQIDSGTADVAGLAAVAALLKPRLEQVGASVETARSTVPGLGDSLVATLTGGGRGRILLIAHMDTVFVKGTAAQRPYQVVGEHGVGPGAGDDKQGIVTALCALRIVRQIEFRDFAKIVLILNANEETGSFGSRDLIAAQARASDVAINLERGVPPDGVVVARKGSGTITIEIEGRAAHSGLEPEKGRNAVIEAVHQIHELALLANPALETTVNVTMIQGGNAVNVIPEHASLKADVRAYTAEEFERVEKGVQASARAPSVPDVHVTAVLARGFPPWPRAASTDALLARAQALSAELGRTLTAVAVGSSADSALAAATGTPSIDGLGALGGGAHGADDYVDLASIVPRSYLLARLLMDLGRDPPARVSAQ